MRRKLLLGIIILFAAPTILFARGGGGGGAHAGAAAGELTAAANKAQYADEPVNTDTTTNVVTPATTPAAPTGPTTMRARANSSLYGGLGVTMLNDKGFTGPMPKIYIGVGTFIGQSKTYYGALELAGGMGSLPLSSNQQYRIKNMLSISAIPGYMVSDTTMLFFRLGAISSRYSNLNSTKRGGLYGFGVQFYSSPKWDARVEYDYSNNKNLNQFSYDFIFKFR